MYLIVDHLNNVKVKNVICLIRLAIACSMTVIEKSTFDYSYLGCWEMDLTFCNNLNVIDLLTSGIQSWSDIDFWIL